MPTEHDNANGLVEHANYQKSPVNLKQENKKPENTKQESKKRRNQTQVSNLCRDCVNHLPAFNATSVNCCDICSTPLKHPSKQLPSAIIGRCSHCYQSSPYISRVYSFYRYEFPIDYWLQQYKFHQQTQYAKLLCQLFAKSYRAMEAHNTEHKKINTIIPIPSHPLRQNEHGFDHTLLLAKELSQCFNIPYCEALIRNKNDQPLSKLGASDRQKYIKDSYQFVGKYNLGNVALIDDIITSGSTVKEATKTLFEAGIEDIEVWAMAKVLKK